MGSSNIIHENDMPITVLKSEEFDFVQQVRRSYQYELIQCRCEILMYITKSLHILFCG